MKRIAFVVMFFFGGITLYAQNDLDFMKDARYFNLEIDQNSLNSESRDRIEVAYLDRNISADSALVIFNDYILLRFLKSINETLDNTLVVLNNRPADLKIIYHLLQVDNDGDSLADIDIVKSDTGEVCYKLKIRGEGGKFGSFINLCGDGSEKIAEKLGRTLKGMKKGRESKFKRE